MKIGILSMQRVINYGSFLQAYALKKTLESLGNECYFIDIKPGRSIIEDTAEAKRKSKVNFIIGRFDRFILRRIQHHFYIKKRKERFINEFFPILGVEKTYNYNSQYDIVVIGSDEVFNCARNVKWGFAKTLFGEGIESDRIITYAASCGNTTLDKLNQYSIREEVQKALQNINVFSVRDDNTKHFVETLTNKKAIENIDPTLIYDFSEKLPSSIPEKNYILIYAYDNRIDDNETINVIKSFAKKHKKKIISAGVYQNWCDKNILCTPFELLAYFRDADYVVTDTFHGTVFSIKYNKCFASIIRESNKQKLGYLLKKFNLSNRELVDLNNLENILNQRPDYESVNEIIKKETQSAKEYFLDNLKF